MRVTKNPEVRRAEIMNSAEQLFFTKGYNQTTIVDILNDVDIAKGTFYYYFKSKEEILDAIIERIIDDDVRQAQKIVDDMKIPVLDKLFRVLLGQRPKTDNSKNQMLQQIHQPANAEMHQKSLVRSITRMTPVLTSIVEQGIQEGVMCCEYPKEMMEFLLTAGQIVFDEGLFQWTPEELFKKVKAYIQLMESVLGTNNGSFDYMIEILLGKANEK